MSHVMSDRSFHARPPSRYPELERAGMPPAQQEAFARFRLWRILIPVAVWYSFYYLGRLNWGICLPWITQELKITPLQIGMVEAVLFWTYAVSTFGAGRASDVVGSRRLQLSGGIGTTLFNICMGVQSAFTGFVGFMGLNGLAQGLASAPTTRLIAQWFPRARRGFANGVFVTSFSSSTVIAWLVVGYTAAHFGWREAFIWPLLVFVLPSTLLLYALVRDTPQQAGFPAYVEEKDDSDSAQAEALSAEEVKGVRAWLTLLRNWRFVLACLASFTVYIARFGLLTWVPLFFAETAGIKIKDIPIMTVALPVGMLLGPLVAGWISDKVFHAKRYPMILTYIAGAVTVLGVIAAVPLKVMGLGWAMVLLFLAGFFVLGVLGTMWTLAIDFGGRTLPGTAVGTLNFFNYLGAGFQGILIGGILNYSDRNWSLVFTTVAGLLIVGAVLSALVRK